VHLGFGRAGPSPDHLLFGRCFLFFGLLALWLEPLFWGLGELFPSGHMVLKLKNRYLNVKLVPFFGFPFG
jgi:hypothetical protein